MESVILSGAKNLARRADRFFAPLRMTTQQTAFDEALILTLLLTPILTFAACASQSPPIVVSYATMPPLTATPTPTPAISPTPVQRRPTRLPIPGSASATPAPGAPSTIPGQVSADRGQFVTTSSPESRYYYARSDPGWHRIHPEHRVWFQTAAALERAFPGRELHQQN